MQVRAKVTCFIGGARRKAGAVFEYNGEAEGPIEAVDAPAEIKPEAEVPEPTRSELKARLDQAGVKYGANDNKETLSKLLAEATAEIAPASSGVPSKSPLDGGSI